jgi:hypothetical protein
MRFAQVFGLLVVVVITYVMGHEDGYHSALSPGRAVWWRITIPLAVVATATLVAALHS